MAAQDDNEPFDLVDADGRPLGETKARRLVHKDGDWHRSLHIWVVISGPAPLLVFQKRSAGKDTWPGALDVSVSGHYRAGESLAEALREAEEEIGVGLGESDVVRLGMRRRSDRSRAGHADNEVQDIFAARLPCSLTELSPNADEVAWLCAIRADDAARLFLGAERRVTGQAISARERTPFPVMVERGDFVADEDGYYARAVRAVLNWLDGKVPTPFFIG